MPQAADERLEDTPVLLVDMDRMKANIDEMAAFARREGLKLRPHVKTHKSPILAKMQLERGATGITVAKISEAQVMADAGIGDILIAYPIVGEVKLRRYFSLARRVHLSCIIDNLEAARLLGATAMEAGTEANVLIKVNVGLNRCGMAPGRDLLNFAREASVVSGLRIKGILSHAGHAYSAQNPEEVLRIGRLEGEVMVEAAAMLRKAGIMIEEVSVGSTPTVRPAGEVPGVTEIRPGNYIFYDAMQVALGVVGPRRCALKVLSRVVSRPSPERAVIDAGSKTLGLDRGGHGTSLLQGHGMIVGMENATIERLSEEHGILSIPPDSPLSVGDILEIIPNHACTVVNNFDDLVGVRNGEIQEIWPVAARGKNR